MYKPVPVSPGLLPIVQRFGVADDGDTIEQVLERVQEAIKAYVDSLIEDKQIVPTGNYAPF